MRLDLMKPQLDLIKAFALKDVCFLPKGPKRRQSGETLFSPKDGARLELIGGLQMNPFRMERNSYAAILGIVADCREIPVFRCMYTGWREVSLAQGLQQFGNSVSLSQRLSGPVELCPKAILDFIIPDTKAFIYEIRDSRIYYTHYTAFGKKRVKRHGELFIPT